MNLKGKRVESRAVPPL